MIASFADKATADLYHGRGGRAAGKLPPDVRRIAPRKLDVLNAAGRLQDLRSPPGNRLEALKGPWQGLHSIRINSQWRLVFRWEAGAAHDVRIVDYH